jgi:hypothetical protein
MSEYWLAQELPRAKGLYRSVALIDGCHSSPDGVAQAKKLMQRIFGEEGTEYIMVTLDPVPDKDIPINEEAAAICAAAVSARNTRISHDS